MQNIRLENHSSLLIDNPQSNWVFFVIKKDGTVTDGAGKPAMSWEEVFALVKPWLEAQGVSFDSVGAPDET